MSRVFVGIAGASGAIYAQRLLETLAEMAEPSEILVTATNAGRKVMEEEVGARIHEGYTDFEQWLRVDAERIQKFRYLPVGDLGAPPASGSYPIDSAAVVPCSMRTLGALAHGVGENLLCRAIDVALKEGRRVVLAPRETPLSVIHLENMLRLARLGVRIVAPAPGFYHHPQTVDDLVDFVVQRIVNQMGFAPPNPVTWDPTD